MSLPYWGWTIRFQNGESSGESTVIAPHPAAAKQSVAAAVTDIETFESVVALDRVATSVAEQHLDGYYLLVQKLVPPTQDKWRR